jgi:ribosomal protein S18 acetylase RimI-like enzyme
MNERTGHYLFFRRPTSPTDADLQISLPPGYSFHVHTPSFTRIMPYKSSWGVREGYFYWLMRKFAPSARKGKVAVYYVDYNGSPACCALVVPYSRRHSFMAAQDRQVSPIDTWPEHRRKGIALALLRFILRDLANTPMQLWYLTRSENVASIHLAEKAGLQRYGVGVRRDPLGLKLFASYHIETVL